MVGILNVDLTGSFCCDFEFSCFVLQRGRVWEALKKSKNKSK